MSGRRIGVVSLLVLMAGLAVATSGAEIIDSKFELFVSDPAESVAFYALLGFDVVHEQPSGYTTLRSGSTVVALSPLPWWLPVHWFGFLRYPPLGTEIVLYVSDLEESRGALERAGHAPGAIDLQAWGDRDFRTTDPDGYYVRVSEGSAVPQAH